MSDRSVSVKLDLSVAGFLTGVERAKLATKDFANDATKSAKEHGQAWEKVGKASMLTGGVILAGVGMAVKAYADFDASMSQVQAGTGAAGKSLDALRAAAIKAGADTQYSATEAADAITAMGKAGVSTKDILNGGLNGALALAAAGQLDVGKAAEIAATSMVQFGLSGKDIPHIADLLAAGAGKSMGSVEDLSGALKYAGVVATGAGWSIEETTGVLAEFAQAGIGGEQAGTSLRGVIMALEGPSAIAAKAMENLGINMYDTNGHFLKAAPLAQLLKDKLGPLDEATRNAAMAQIFGNEQITAARVLYEGGAGAVDKWTKSVDSAGFASQQAALLTDNLSGDIERLGGSMSSVLIQSGSATNGMLRTMTQELQGVVDLYGSLPVPVQQGATVLATVAGAAALVTGGLIVLAPRIAATKLALAGMGRTGEMLSTGMSKAGSASKMLGGPLIIATAALGYFAKQAQESKGRVDAMADSLDAQSGAVTDNTRAWVNKNLSDSGALGEANRLGISVKDVTDAVLGNAAALARVTTAVDTYTASLPNNRAGMLQAAETHHLLSNAISGGNEELNKGIAKTQLLADANAAGGSAAAGAADKTGMLTGAQQALKTSTEDAKKAIDDEVASMQSAGLVVLSTRDARRQMIEAINAGSDAVKKNGQTLDINTQKGRDNQVALDGVAGKALSLADSIYKETGSEEAMRASLVTSRASLVTSAQHFGMTKDQANRYADSVLKIPAAASTTVNANTAPASAKLAALQRQLDAATADQTVNIRYYVTTSGKAPALGGSAKSVFNVGTNAAGTDNWRGGATWVGERGPEIAYLPPHAVVVPNHKTAAYVAAPSTTRYVSAPSGSRSPAPLTSGGASRSGESRPQQIKVFIGDKELTDLVRVEVDGHTQALTDALVYGGH